MLMLGSVNRKTGRYLCEPGDTGGRETRGVTLVVDDADAVYARAQAAGAKILRKLEDRGAGGRHFVCRDPEGRIWWVTTYDPWRSPG